MTQLALDSSTVLTWVLQEPHWKVVDTLIQTPGLDLILPGPALTEIVWIARKKGNVSTGATIATTLRAHGFRIEHPIDSDLLRAAELLEISKNASGPMNPRTSHPVTLSLGDASILAVVERLGCPIVTRDSYWNQLAAKKLINVTVQAF